jgi:hypothetical protein
MAPPIPLPEYIRHQIDLLTAIKCNTDKLGLTPNGQVAVTVVPPHVSKALWGHVVIGTTPTLIRPENEKRLQILLVNASVQTVYMGTDDSVTIAGAANPGTEFFAQSAWDEDKYTGALYGVVSLGTAILSYWEE